MSETDIPNFNFAIVRGDDTTVSFRYLADGSPADLRGSIMSFACSAPGLDQVCSMPLPQSGRFTAHFGGEATNSTDLINLRYNVYRYPQGLLGPRTTVFSGKFKIKDESLA